MPYMNAFNPDLPTRPPMNAHWKILTLRLTQIGRWSCVGAIGIVILATTSYVAAQTPSATIVASETPQKMTWLIVRHAERDGEADALTDAGERRAQTLAELGQVLNVNAIYATNFQRTRGTAKPLAEALELSVNLYEKPTMEWLASVRQEHPGGVILVVGHSNTVGRLVSLLANVDPFDLAHEEYDGLFIVTERGNERNLVHLRFGSSTTSPTPLPPEQMGPIKSP
jgi:2,3-bisphosphoglycerate-dependent phosphoglycerate mutase